MKNDFFVHESSCIDGSPSIGDGTKVWHFSHIMDNAIIGKNCIIGQNVFISDGAVVGDNVKIQNNVSIYEGVEIEDDVFIGPSVVFTNVINPRSHVERKDEFKKTVVKKGASIGANSTIVCGNTIGEYSFIGAGSVVTKAVTDHAIFYGVPAKRKGWMCSCGERLTRMIKRQWYCNKCCIKYKYDWHKLKRLM
jgi:UDP-2-acetamido-3-amino-2,3-dideoxy-glucuronate N-acetyltransferase